MGVRDGGGERGVGHGRRPILIVEDDEDLVSCLSALLEEEGYPVLQTSSGVEAVQLCRNAPALVLLDLHLPGPLAGAQLVRALREHLDPATRVLLLTGDRDVPRRAEEIGVDGFLEKPFDVEALLRLVDESAGGSAH